MNKTTRSAPDAHDCSTEGGCLADRLGVFAAAACAVHCMAAPLVLAFLPAIGGIWASPGTHWVFAAISLPAALSLIWRSSRGRSRAARRALIGLAAAGAMLVITGLAAPGADWSKGMEIKVPLSSEATSSSLNIGPGDDHSAELLAQGGLFVEEGCQDECCASISMGEDGRRVFRLPAASIVTMLGGLLLVAAHAFALFGRPH